MDLIGSRGLDGVEQKLAHLRVESARTAQQSTAAREEAAESRLNLWLQRLASLQGQSGRDVVHGWALEAAMSSVSADFANVQRLHPNGNGLVLEAQRGFGNSFLNFFEFTHDRHSACGLAMHEHRAVVVEDVMTSPVFENTPALEELQKAGIRAVRSIPLVGSTGQLLGMLSVHYSRPRAHSAPELKRLQLLADAVARLLK